MSTSNLPNDAALNNTITTSNMDINTLGLYNHALSVVPQFIASTGLTLKGDSFNEGALFALWLGDGGCIDRFYGQLDPTDATAQMLSLWYVAHRVVAPLSSRKQFSFLDVEAISEEQEERFACYFEALKIRHALEKAAQVKKHFEEILEVLETQRDDAMAESYGGWEELRKENMKIRQG